MMLPADFPDRQLASFAGRLRRRGLAASAAEVADAVRAVAAMEILGIDEFRETLRLCLVKRVEDSPVFDEEFDRFFLKEEVVSAAALQKWKEGLPPDDALDGGLSASAAPEKGDLRGGQEEEKPWRSALAQEQGLPESFRAYLSGDELGAVKAARREAGRVLGPRILEAVWQAVESGGIAQEEYPRVLQALERYAKLLASTRGFRGPEPQLPRKAEVRARPVQGAPPLDLPMNSLSERQVRELQEHIRGAAQRLYTRLVRLSGDHSRRLCFDYRQTIRKSLAAFGEPFWPVYRARKRKLRQLLTICDVSGSVKYAAKILLCLMYEVHQAFEGRARHFVFVGRLDEVTAFFGENSFEPCFARVMRAADVDYYGYSDYGLAFRTFAQHFLDAVDSDTVVLVLGDARNNRKDPGAQHLGEICGRARASVWLNPEARGKWDTGDSILSIYRKRVDRVVEVSRFGQLLEFVDELPAIVGAL